MDRNQTTYWLRVNGGPWQRISRERFAFLEGEAGYKSPKKGVLATGGFIHGKEVEVCVVEGERGTRQHSGDKVFYHLIRRAYGLSGEVGRED